MRIAIPLNESALIADHFSAATTFALYDVHDDTRAVQYRGRESLQDPACSRTPAFLRSHEVEVILARDLSPNAEQHLLEAGIVAIKDTPSLSADALIAHLVSGTLQATPPGASANAGESSCQPGGCGHCSGHHQHAEPHE